MTFDTWAGTQAGPPTPAPVPFVIPTGPPPVAPPPAVAWAPEPVVQSDPDPDPGESGNGSGRWIAVAAGVVCLVLVGVGLAWFLAGDPGTATPSAAAASEASGQGSGGGAPLQPSSVTASCQSADGNDAAGNVTSYDPELTLDGRLDTAWRCDGSAVGARLVLEFDHPVTVTAVGLVPGYAKIDPESGENRFGQNHTVTAATWLFDDGTTHLQQIAAPEPVMTPSDLAAAVTTTRVVLQITGTGNPTAARDFTAVSDVLVSGY